MKVINFPNNNFIMKINKKVNTRTGRIVLEEAIKAYPTYLAIKELGITAIPARMFLDLFYTRTKNFIRLGKLSGEQVDKLKFHELFNKKLLENPFNTINLALKLFGFGK